MYSATTFSMANPMTGFVCLLYRYTTSPVFSLIVSSMFDLASNVNNGVRAMVTSPFSLAIGAQTMTSAILQTALKASW